MNHILAQTGGIPPMSILLRADVAMAKPTFPAYLDEKQVSIHLRVREWEWCLSILKSQQTIGVRFFRQRTK
jgi:hypothetical protein